MSRSQPAGLARDAINASHASAAHMAQQPRHTPSASNVVTATPVSNQALGQALGGGRQLEPSVRAEMESRFGADFGAVRIHDEPSAHGLAQQHRAQAFALGNHIAFNRGRYAPGQSEGKHLLAHELAHVVQQRRGGTMAPVLEGGGLEQAADHAASAVVAGAGPVQVAGASAAGVARQPLPEDEMRDLPPPPASLSGSLAKDEKNLKEPGLEYEMALIEGYLDALPTAPQRDHLLSEYKALFQERVARRKRAPPSVPWPKLEELTREVQEAHRAWRLTGEMPQTHRPFSWAEIKVGKPMTRRERYDFMLKLQGQDEPVTFTDVAWDKRHPGEGRRDPEFLTHEEFDEEFHERFKKEVQDCVDDNVRPDPRDRCIWEVKGKYGGPGYRAFREEQYQRSYALWVHAQEQIESMKSGGLASLAGRVAGYGLGALTGHDRLLWSEYGADIGSVAGIAGTTYIGYSQRSQLQSYNAGGGLTASRDAEIHLIEPRSPGMTPTSPEPVPPKLTPGGPPRQSTIQPPSSSASTGSTGPAAAIPISSGKGLPQSDASKALAANLAKQSPQKVGSVTPLPVGKSGTPPQSEPAQQKLPVAAAMEEKIAVGQTHGAGGGTAPGGKPAPGVAGAGAQATVASAKTAGKSTTTTGTAAVKRGVTAAPASKSPAAAGKGRSGTAPTTKAPAATGTKGAQKLVPVNASGGRGTNAGPLVAVRVGGGGSARKGTYFVEGTPEFEAASKDKRNFTVMPESWATTPPNNFRPAGTPFDRKIEPLKIAGVQVESSGAGTGKGSKHNIAGRADIQPDPTANAATFGKTVGASVKEAHGYKASLDDGEVGVIRPGNASTGGVDSITADVGRTAKTAAAGKAAPTGKAAAAGPKVFLNDYTGPKTTKGAKATHANWVNELRDAVVHPLFGFINKAYDIAVHDAIQKGDVYVREVRIEDTLQGTKVTPLPPRKVSVPASVKRDVAKARPDKP